MFLLSISAGNRHVWYLSHQRTAFKYPASNCCPVPVPLTKMDMTGLFGKFNAVMGTPVSLIGAQAASGTRSFPLHRCYCSLSEISLYTFLIVPFIIPSSKTSLLNPRIHYHSERRPCMVPQTWCTASDDCWNTHSQLVSSYSRGGDTLFHPNPW